MRCLCTLAFFLTTISLLHAGSDEEKWSKYETIDYKRLSIGPEDFKNDKVSFEGPFVGFTTTFPRYMEDSGFDSGKYIAFAVNDAKVPILAKKRTHKELDDLLATFNKGDVLKCYGKIRKFREKPEWTAFPRYYLDLEHVELIQAAAEARDEKWQERKKTWMEKREKRQAR